MGRHPYSPRNSWGSVGESQGTRRRSLSPIRRQSRQPRLVGPGRVVAYEQEIGRRVPGQRADGTFDVAVSRTIPGDRSALIEKFASLVGDTLNEVALDGDPRTSETAKRSFWRANLEGGTKVEAAAETKSEDKTLFVLTTSKLPSPEALEEWRAFGKDFLKQL